MTGGVNRKSYIEGILDRAENDIAVPVSMLQLR